MMTRDDVFAALQSYEPQADRGLFDRACALCENAHRSQKTPDGRDYFHHPLEVAAILTRLKGDQTTVLVGLLHDLLHTHETSHDQILQIFGSEVASLVAAGHKLSNIPYRQKNRQQVESFRKMFVAMARDLRVVMVYLADRLSDMRTVHHCARERQEAYSRETLEVYAPLANRLGISWLKAELEDLSLKILDPVRYAALEERITTHKEKRGDYIDKVGEQIRALLAQSHLRGDVTGRFKHFYSVYRKMERTGVDLDEIYDLIAFRILVDSVRECYEALGLVHATWKPISGRFKDYIAMPKPNMYQSLHTSVIGPFGERMEVQIRTHQMHSIAEEGVAAHWKYKEGGPVPAVGRDDQHFSWLRQALEWQHEVSDRPAADAAVIDLFPEEVYVFTPQGEVKELPKGASPVDFAYAIHTDVGSHCIGARINGKMSPLKAELKNGDIVEVMTASHQTPRKDWLTFVKTSKARNKIRQWIKIQQREKSITIGRELVEKALRKQQMSIKRAMSTGLLDQTVLELGFRSADDLYASVGYGKTSPGLVTTHIIPRQDKRGDGEQTDFADITTQDSNKRPSQSAILIGGIDNVMVRFAHCCNPLPGEPVTGFITRGRGLTVHSVDCFQVRTSDPERRIDVEWDMQRKTLRPVKIRVICEDQKGMLVGITGAISQADANIVSATVHARGDKNRKGTNLFVIDVENLEHLNRVIREIRKVKGVNRVERIRN